jgi:hypothetical protein
MESRIWPQRTAHAKLIPVRPIIIQSVGVFKHMHSCSSEEYWVWYYTKGDFLAKQRQQNSWKQRSDHKGQLTRKVDTTDAYYHPKLRCVWTHAQLLVRATLGRILYKRWFFWPKDGNKFHGIYDLTTKDSSGKVDTTDVNCCPKCRCVWTYAQLLVWQILGTILYKRWFFWPNDGNKFHGIYDLTTKDSSRKVDTTDAYYHPKRS